MVIEHGNNMLIFPITKSPENIKTACTRVYVRAHAAAERRERDTEQNHCNQFVVVDVFVPMASVDI